MNQATQSHESLEKGIHLASGMRHEIIAGPQETAVIEAEDVLFNLNSAVLLPSHPRNFLDKPAPATAISEKQEYITGIGVIYSVYRFVEAWPDRELIIAGHSDSSGSVRYNYEISRERGENAYFLLTGDRDKWAGVSLEKHIVRDVQHILKHFAKVLYWPCDPGAVDNEHGKKTRQALWRFQESYNENREALGIRQRPAIPIRDLENGKLNVETWKAVFDLYIWQIAGKLKASPDDDGMQEWREKIRLADPDCRVVACSESFPVDSEYRENYRSQQNRRVEFLFFAPGEAPEFPCPAPRDTILTIEECPLYNRSRFKPVYIDPDERYLARVTLQSVDELDHPVGNAEFILSHRDDLAADIEVQTDDTGYWTRQHVPAGVYDVFLPDGTPVKGVIRAGETEYLAQVDTAYGSSAITSVIVQEALSGDERERMERNRAHYRRGPDIERRQVSGRGGEPQTARRSMFVAADNLSLVAGWTDDFSAINESRLLTVLNEWLGDYYPVVMRDGYFVMLFHERRIVMYSGTGELIGAYAPAGHVSGVFGAYALFEAGAYKLFFDMATRSSGIALADQGILPIDELVAESDRERFVHDFNGQTPRHPIVYQTPDADLMFALALLGCSGRFEDYGANEAVNSRIHERNLEFARNAALVHRSVIRNYITRVEEAGSAADIHRMGPPRDVHIFPRPVNASMDRYRELLSAYDSSAYPAWVAINKKLNALAGRIPDGTMMFRVRFTLAQEAKATDPFPYGEVKTEWNFDITEDGVFKKRSSAMVVGQKFSGSPTIRGSKLALEAGHNYEIDLETGETKATIHAKIAKWGIEASDDGSQKVTGPFGTSASGNMRAGQFGFGAEVGLRDLLMRRKKQQGDDVADDAFKNFPDAKLYMGLHFQGLRQETMLAWFSRAPGFFEKRLLDELLSPEVQWSDLFSDERAHLDTLGWTPETWDAKHVLPYDDFPDSTRSNPYNLTDAQQIAIVHLGFYFDGWVQLWRSLAGQ